MILEIIYKARCKHCKFHEIIKIKGLKRTWCKKNNNQTTLKSLACEKYKSEYEQ